MMKPATPKFVLILFFIGLGLLFGLVFFLAKTI